MPLPLALVQQQKAKNVKEHQQYKAYAHNKYNAYLG
jgi:hypothetical protein